MLNIPAIPVQSVVFISSTTAAVLLPPQYLRIGIRPFTISFMKTVISSFSAVLRQGASPVVAKMQRKSAPLSS